MHNLASQQTLRMAIAWPEQQQPPVWHQQQTLFIF